MKREAYMEFRRRIALQDSRALRGWARMRRTPPPTTQPDYLELYQKGITI